MKGTSIILPAPLSIQELQERQNPPANSWDVYQDVIYDTQTYVQAGPAAGSQLKFFSDQTHADTPSKSNMVGNVGQMQAGHLFHAIALRFDVLSGLTYTAAATKAGELDDVLSILYKSRAYVEYSNRKEQRTRAPIPLHMVGGNSGARGIVTGRDSAAAGFIQSAQTAEGGFPLDAVLYPQQGFSLNITFPVQAAISADVDVRVSLIGWHYVSR